jgi:predicted transcriptional regulator of viral defense system
MRGKPQPRPDPADEREVLGRRGNPERAVARLAARQHGVATRAQLESLGLRGHAIDYRIQLGRLRRLHRGVYLVGPIAPPLAREMAAVLTCGEDAVLSHSDAARLWQLLPHPASPGPVHVTVPGRALARRSGIHVHRTDALPPDERTILDSIPVTTPVRTILDLAGGVEEIELEQALATALRRPLVTRRRVLALLARHPRRRGSRAVRALLDPLPCPPSPVPRQSSGS